MYIRIEIAIYIIAIVYAFIGALVYERQIWHAHMQKTIGCGYKERYFNFQMICTI